MKTLTWQDIHALAAVIAPTLPPASSLYGVPRGGWHAAQALRQCGNFTLVSDPAKADVIVDDLIDSGSTQARFLAEYPHAKFVAFIDKRGATAQKEWIVFPWEGDEPGGAEDAVRRVLQRIGENPDREGLVETPKRFVKALLELTSGLREDPKEHLRKDFGLDDAEPVEYGGMIISAGIPFTSLCEHHLLPFTGEISIAYIPSEEKKRVVGLSKLARMADGYARRPQVQERLTAQIADALAIIEPAGVAVIVRAKHTCQCLRGVKKDGCMITSSVSGVFEDAAVRAEFLSLLQLNK